MRNRFGQEAIPRLTFLQRLEPLVAQADPLIAHADPLIAPDGVLPARVPKNKAQAGVQQWLQTRWFAPNALKRMVESGQIKRKGERRGTKYSLA